MPYADFEKIAKCLDYKRLGKQRVEAMQIHRIVSGTRAKGGWLNHPAVKMWFNHEDALAAYHNAMLYEWMYRGYINNMPKLPHSNNYIIPLFIGVKTPPISITNSIWGRIPMGTVDCGVRVVEELGVLE